MADTPLAAVNNLKRTHAQEIVTALQAVTALIEAQPDLWFGGLPPILAQMVQQADHPAACHRPAARRLRHRSRAPRLN